MSQRDTDQPRVDRDLRDQLLVRDNGLAPNYYINDAERQGRRGGVQRVATCSEDVGARGFYLHAKHFGWIPSVAIAVLLPTAVLGTHLGVVRIVSRN